MKLIILVHDQTNMTHAAQIYSYLRGAGLCTPCDFTALHDSAKRMKVVDQLRRNPCALFIVPYEQFNEGEYLFQVRKLSREHDKRFLFLEPSQAISAEIKAFTGLRL